MTPAPKWKDAYEAAAKNDFQAVKHFAEEDEDVLGLIDKKGRSVALIAAHKNNFSILKYALEKDNDTLLLSDYSGHNIIQRAIENGALDTVKYLVEHHKWDIHYRNKPSLGNTPIHHAAKEGQLEILKYFIEEKKGEVNVRNDFGDPPVFLAAEEPHINIIKYLVEKGKADLTATNQRNENILFIAAEKGHLAVMQYVLDERKTPLDINWTDKYHYTILYLAIKHDHPRMIKYLVEQKHADVNIADHRRRSPLHMAAYEDNYFVCRYLVEHGADLKARDKMGITPPEYTNDDKIIEYFEEMVHERGRRSVLTHPSVSHIRNAELPNRIINTECSQEVKGLSEMSYKNNSQLQSFLLVAGAVVRYATGALRKERREALQSPPEMILARMDRIAVDAIHDFFHLQN